MSPAQIEIVGQFNDYSWENPKSTFAVVARKQLGAKAFAKTSNGRKFRSECKKVFDSEREG